MKDKLDLIKRIFHFISTIILYSLFFIMIIVGIMVGAYFIDRAISSRSGVQRAPLFGAYMIVSQSMEPAIHVGDGVVTMRVSANKLEKEDIITFFADEHGVVVTHRIVGIFGDEEKGYAYRTKGDNNNVEDDQLIPYDRVYGKVILRIPYLGYIQQFLTSSNGWIVVIVLPCMLIIGNDIVKLVKGETFTDDKKDKKNTIVKEKK